MARPLRIVYPGAFYHITSRGNDRKDIFREQEDREKFLSYLQSANQRYGALIHVFCLMDNHYHILMETPLGNLSQIMMHINGTYTTYFNVKHQRSGHLFQGRYKAILVDKDEYAKELSSKPSINEMAEYTKSILGEDRALSRGIQIYLICKYSGKMLNEIGRCLILELRGYLRQAAVLP